MCKLFHIGKSSDLYLWFLLKTKLDVHFCDVMNTFLLYFKTFAKLNTVTLYNIIKKKKLKDCLVSEADHVPNSKTAVYVVACIKPSDNF